MIIVQAFVDEQFGCMHAGTEVYFVAPNVDVAIDYALREYFPDWRGKISDNQREIIGQELVETGETDFHGTNMKIEFSKSVPITQERLDFMFSVGVFIVCVPEGWKGEEADD